MAYICKQFAPASAADLLVQVEAQLVNMGWALHDRMIPFDTGTNPAPIVGDQLEGVLSGARFNITNIVLTGGSWVGHDAAGFFGINNVTGLFQGEILKNNTHPLNPQAHTFGPYHVVCKSAGEAGIWLTGYIDFSILAATITVLPYLWWNAATHAGNTQGNSRTFTYGAGGTYVIAGDKDLVLVRRVAAAGDCLFGHIPKPFHTTPLATLLAPCLAGNGIVLTISDTTNFVLNQSYSIVGALGEGRYRCNVVGIGIGTITVNNLGAAFGIGAKIGANPCTFGVSAALNIFYVAWERAAIGNGATAEAGNLLSLLLNSVAPNIFDPDEGLGLAGAPWNTPGMYVLQPLKLDLPIASAQYPVAISDTNFLFPPLHVAENTFGVTASGSPIDTGTADNTSGNFTLVCLGKLWGVNAHQNKIVIIASGTGLGQTRKIASNTADTLTVNIQWDTNPNGTSIFFIVDKAYRIPTTKTDIAYNEVI